MRAYYWRRHSESPQNVRLSLQISYVKVSLFISYFSVDGQDVCMNVYDVRLDDVAPACGMNWPPEVKEVTTYLGVRPI